MHLTNKNKMSKEEIEKMWSIDASSQLGEKISNEDKEFFNKMYEQMREKMEDNWTHWQFHSGRV